MKKIFEFGIFKSLIHLLTGVLVYYCTVNENTGEMEVYCCGNQWLNIENENINFFQHCSEAKVDSIRH